MATQTAKKRGNAEVVFGKLANDFPQAPKMNRTNYENGHIHLENGHKLENDHKLKNGHKLENGHNLENGHKLENGHSLKNGHGIENGRLEEGEILKTVCNLVLKNKLVTGDSIEEKVVDFKHPHELKPLLNLNVDAEGIRNDEKQVNEILENIIKYSVRTRHPYFYNQLYKGIDDIALAGAWITDALNTNQYTYETGPVLVLIEGFLINFFIKKFGWQDGDGIFNPGGSMSNLYGMILARHRFDPDIKTSGLFGKKPLAVLTSDVSHYSFKKSAALTGIGLDHVIAVQTDEQGSMQPEELQKAIHEARARGLNPYFVNATAGSTVFGSFDPLDRIAEVCKAEGLWLHVDACWGGSVVLSNKHKHLLRGIENVDSLSWNPHKMVCAPLQCAMFLVKHKGLLHETNCLGATYLFQQDKFYDVSYDTGDKSIQCGRKADSVKFWLMLKVHGLQHFEKEINNAFEVARYLEVEMKKRPNFRLVMDTHQCTNVCFWYIPPSLQGLVEDEAWKRKLSEVAPKIKKAITECGSLMIGYQPMKSRDLVNFFRMVIHTTPSSSFAHMDYVLNEIDKHGRHL